MSKPQFETPLEYRYLIECELRLMKEGYLFWCYIYGKKWKSNFIMNISMLQGM